MQKLLKNAYMEIVVLRDVVLGKEKFRPADNLTAEATDDSRSRWHIFDVSGSSVCVVDWIDLERWNKKGLINY